MSELEIVLEYLPITLRKEIISNIGTEEDKIEEIRLRSNKRLCLKIGQETMLTEYIVSQQELLQTFEKICENSIYSYRRQICEGFITIRGGNRVGIVGSGDKHNI